MRFGNGPARRRMATMRFVQRPTRILIDVQRIQKIVMRSARGLRRMNLQAMTTEQLVRQFAELALQQDAALSANDIAAVNRLFDQLDRVERELKARMGDQRRALLPLYDHPNPRSG
jgi:hypothetical protein